jgi:uncharacterized protein
MTAPFLRDTPEGSYLSIKLQPRASKTGVHGVHGTELKLSVTAPPVDAAANEALVRFLAELLDCPRSAVQLVRGQTSRHKTVLIRGLASSQILPKLVSG